MKTNILLSIIVLSATLSCKKKDPSTALPYRITDTLYHEPFDHADTTAWIVEAEDDFNLADHVANGVLDIDVAKGFTLWNNRRFEGNVMFEFHVTVVDEDGENDRVSDLNCFWMATDPESPDDFFARSEWRNGIFQNYYSLKLYYVGYGGNNNTTTRFRKYNGIASPLPPVIQEYTDSAHLIVPNKKHIVQALNLDSTVYYYFNGEKLFELKEEQPYKEGYFGFRTIDNHMRIESFTAYAIKRR